MDCPKDMIEAVFSAKAAELVGTCPRGGDLRVLSDAMLLFGVEVDLPVEWEVEIVDGERTDGHGLPRSRFVDVVAFSAEQAARVAEADGSGDHAEVVVWANGRKAYCSKAGER